MQAVVSTKTTSMTFSRGEGLITSQFFSAISREEGYEERSESYLAS